MSTDNYTWPVCKCGHFRHDHALGFFGSGACEQCGKCKRFHKHADMTYDDAMKFKEEICSPSQPPTSGTSPNPNLSQYHSYLNALNALSATLPSPSPSEKPSQFRSEPRSVPVVGFRAWTVGSRFKLGIGTEQRLAALNGGYGPWEPGLNRAKCHAVTRTYVGSFAPSSYETPVKHKNFEAAPDPDCTCGFYVLTDFDKVPFDARRTVQGPKGEPYTRTPPVVGAVVGWGRVIQHGDEGWRAEKVQIIALLDCKVDNEHLRLTHELAEIYGVPVVGRTALELLAKEYGDRLP